MTKQSGQVDLPQLHPGRRRQQGRRGPRGRQASAAAVEQIRDLLGDRSLQRDLLIEHLHLIQDRHRAISADHLAALAEVMNLPLAEVFEVATFYAHFDVLAEGESAPPETTLRVCDSVSCMLAGAEQLYEELSTASDPTRVRVLRAPCMGCCDQAPAVAVGHVAVPRATSQAVLNLAQSDRPELTLPDYTSLKDYQAQGGYGILHECRSGKRSATSVLDELADSNLRGLGGAGFPAARKWQAVLGEPAPRLMAVNIDEGEPGTFKDRNYLEREPHRMLEGMLIAAWAVEAETIYIYLRDEYPAIRRLLQVELAKLEAAGLIEPGQVCLRRGAGAYICGEESAMLESIEGRRGLPRQRPPFAAQVGLFGRPTLVHNSETLHWLPIILERGSEWFASQGRRGCSGPRSFSVSGRVAEPGVKLAPAGITLRELIDEYCGGMAPGHTLKAYLPGGGSGGLLPAAKADLPLDFGTLEDEGCFIGSAAIVVLSQHDNMVEVARNLMRFFRDESCGQCTPCRAGTEKAVQLMESEQWDQPLLEDLQCVMVDASICGLGQAACNPVESVMKHFPEEMLQGDDHA